MACGCTPGSSGIFNFWRDTGGPIPATPSQDESWNVDEVRYDMTWLWVQPNFPATPCTDPLPVTLFFNRISGPGGPLPDQRVGFHATGDCSGLKAKAITLVAIADTFTTPAATITQVPIKACEPGLYQIWVDRLTCGGSKLFAAAALNKAAGRLIVEVV